MTREELQIQSLSLIKQSNRVAIQWCTSLGKSRAAIDMANYLIDQKKEEPLKMLLVVAEIPHKLNWREEFQKWKLKSAEVTIECYASLKKYRNSNWDLIIFDEAHHLGSDLRIDILAEIHSSYIILLSATLPDQVIQSISNIFGEFKTSRITLQQAIEWGILPIPRIYLIPLNLDRNNSTCIITEEWGRKEKRVVYNCRFNERWRYMSNKRLYPNITLNISCTPEQKYNYLSEQVEYWKRQFFITRQEFIKNKWLQFGSKRKRFLGELKTNIVRSLLCKIHNKRFICFCSSIEQAELLGRENAIHSEKSDSLSIIQSFNSKKIDNLFAVGMLQEGQNLTDIEIGIIIQLDNQERSFVQKFGRGMRADNPIQFIFYYKNTRDEEYLRNVLEGIDDKYITEIDNLEDIELWQQYV